MASTNVQSGGHGGASSSPVRHMNQVQKSSLANVKQNNGLSLENNHRPALQNTASHSSSGQCEQKSRAQNVDNVPKKNSHLNQ